LFGTDELGRDILSRCIWGARVSLTIGIIASVITVTIGITIGLVSGYYGGWIDIILMRIVDVILAMPNFFLYILAISMFRVRGVWVIATIMGMLNWTSLARIVRGEVLSLKERDYIVASKALGAFDWRIILVHILPNVLAPILVTTTYRMAGFILSESSLSFLGLGDPTSGSWGAVLTSGRKSLRYSPWISTFPGLMLFLTVLGFNMLGDGLRDALDPRLKR
jgi:peptide/nickel transport system permease protein